MSDNTNTKLSPQGYRYGREPRGRHPFWADQIVDITATADVDDEVGTPYVEVEKTEEDEQIINFHFDFHNIKGEPGEPGEPGPQGPGKRLITNTGTVSDLQPGDEIFIFGGLDDILLPYGTDIAFDSNARFYTEDTSSSSISNIGVPEFQNLHLRYLHIYNYTNEICNGDVVAYLSGAGGGTSGYNSFTIHASAIATFVYGNSLALRFNEYTKIENTVSLHEELLFPIGELAVPLSALNGKMFIYREE